MSDNAVKFNVYNIIRHSKEFVLPIVSTDLTNTSNNKSEMKDELDNCTDHKFTDNKPRRIDDYATIKDECIDDGIYTTAVGFINEHNQGSIQNKISIEGENTNDVTVFVSRTVRIPDRTDNKVYLNETAISRVYVKQEPCDVKDERGSIHNYLSVKDENIDDQAVVAQETEITSDCIIDNKVCIHETVISGGDIKKETYDMKDKPGSIRNYVSTKGCEECGEEYDLYCLKCPMLIRIFDSNTPDGRDDTVRRTLPKNFVDIYETPSGMGIIALRTIPKGVVFGPFKGLDSTEDAVSNWRLETKELMYINDHKWLNWMQHIKGTDQSSHPNLTPFQYEGELYYRSEYRINIGDELLVRCDSDSEESRIKGMQDCHWEPPIYERLDDIYACTLCCVGYKSISHLKEHNSTCIEKRNRNDYLEEIVRCEVCKTYLDKEEYSKYHMDRCYRNNGKRTQHIATHYDDRPFACTLCPYKATTNSNLKQHVAFHNGDKPFACTICSHKTTTKSDLKKHIAIHNDDKPFACTLCPYKTRNNSKLKQHAGVHDEIKPFACTLCPYRTTNNSKLKQHVAIHDEDKSFECTFCPYKAKRKPDLKRHIAAHNDDKPFACSFCPYKTTRKSTLKRHVAVHNDDRPFACTLCPYKATTKWKLKQHISVHEGDKPFVCTYCSYKAKSEPFLRRHVIVHSGDKPFACALCPYKATANSSLKRHVASHNRDDDKFATETTRSLS